VTSQRADHRAPRSVLARVLQRVSTIGSLPTDTTDERLSKATLTLSVVLEASMATVWVVLYAVLGLPLSAAIPLCYQIVAVAALIHFARTKRFSFFRSAELVMALFLPFLLQWSLGGFEASSAVSMWAFTSPLGALVFLSPARAVPWFGAFAALVVVSAFLDPHLVSHAADIPDLIRLAFFALNILGVAGSTYFVLQYFVREREEAMAALGREREKSERLLLNVLPEAIAARLKESTGIIAEGFPDVTVLFADIVGFTPLARTMEPEALVELLNELFTRFDALAASHGLEKIKTIGDAYMVAGGLPTPRPDHAEAVADMALAMREAVERVSRETGHPLAIRIGIDTGPVVAGVIGQAKFTYDLWGDTVNTASRMESHGVPGSIQVTERTFERLRTRYILTQRGSIEVKGKGEMRTYLLEGAEVLSRGDRPFTGAQSG
jgi:adenylate cyclase